MAVFKKMNVYCIIVCYNPDINNISIICNKLMSHPATVILVDNTENNCNADLLSIKGIRLISLRENIGIAKAQNIGIKIALDEEADVIVFFDQDSEIDENFLEHLLTPLQIDQPMIVSPAFFDKKEGFQFPSQRLNRFGLLEKIEIKNHELPFEVDVVISSGSAATRKTFEVAGLLEENFFIDFVDIEWSLRCRKAGISIKTIPNARMAHSIGEKSINIKCMRLFIHSPLRSYYKVRNSFLFFRCKNVPALLGIKEIISALIHNFLIILFVKHKGLYIQSYFSGIYKGILGETGKRKQ